MNLKSWPSRPTSRRTPAGTTSAGTRGFATCSGSSPLLLRGRRASWLSVMRRRHSPARSRSPRHSRRRSREGLRPLSVAAGTSAPRLNTATSLGGRGAEPRVKAPGPTSTQSPSACVPQSTVSTWSSARKGCRGRARASSSASPVWKGTCRSRCGETLPSSIQALQNVDEGKERRVEAGLNDVLAEDQEGTRVVIELKSGEAPEAAITQLLSYVGSLQAEDNSRAARGMLIAQSFSPRVKLAARAAGIELGEYGFNFSFRLVGTDGGALGRPANSTPS